MNRMEDLSLYKEAYDHFNEEVFTQEIYSFASQRLYQYHPYLAFTLGSMGGEYAPSKTLTTNSCGLRAVEEPDWSRYRICVLGGSGVFGSYAPRNDKTIPGYIESFFEKKIKDKKIQVINCGHVGHVMSQHLILLHQVILEKYKPDMVVCLAGFNDFLNFIDNLEPGGSRQNEYQVMIRAIQYGSLGSIFKNVFLKTFRIRHKNLNKVFTKLYQIRQILKQKKNNINTNKNVLSSLQSPLEVARCEKHASYFVQQLLYQKSLLDGFGIKFIAGLQPALGLENGKTLTKKENYISQKYASSRKDYFSYLTGYFDTIEKKMLSIKDDHGIQWVNCTTAFNDVNRQIFIDSVHMGDVGNKIVAEQLAKEAILADTGLEM